MLASPCCRAGHSPWWFFMTGWLSSFSSFSKASLGLSPKSLTYEVSRSLPKYILSLFVIEKNFNLSFTFWFIIILTCMGASGDGCAWYRAQMEVRGKPGLVSSSIFIWGLRTELRRLGLHLWVTSNFHYGASFSCVLFWDRISLSSTFWLETSYKDQLALNSRASTCLWDYRCVLPGSGMLFP